MHNFYAQRLDETRAVSENLTVPEPHIYESFYNGHFLPQNLSVIFNSYIQTLKVCTYSQEIYL